MRYTTVHRILLAVFLTIALLPLTSYAQKPTAKTFLEIGIINNQNAEYSEAIDAFKRAIELNPDYAAAYYHLGRAYFSLHRYDEAHNAFMNASKHNPKFADAHFSFAVVSYMLGNDREAINALKKALKIDPKHLNAHMKLGNIYLELEQYQGAANTYEKALKIKSKNAEARYNLGIAYLGLSKKYMSSARKQQNALKKLDKGFATDLDAKIRGKK
jgi:tetratricopeptide (TPR) repeat protein